MWLCVVVAVDDCGYAFWLFAFVRLMCVCGGDVCDCVFWVAFGCLRVCVGAVDADWVCIYACVLQLVSICKRGCLCMRV